MIPMRSFITVSYTHLDVYKRQVFNYSAINNYGASFAKGEYLLLLNNDTEIINPDCLEELLGYCMRKDVGAVGARDVYKRQEVTCIELSMKRSKINAYRHQDQDDLKIVVGNFQEIKKNLTEKYDYITLIGVLEYGESYIRSENPYVDFLRIISKHLKPDGKIILAIENRLGLKYLSLIHIYPCIFSETIKRDRYTVFLQKILGCQRWRISVNRYQPDRK